jgi:predicted amidohydrolase YtcJ
VARSDDGRRVLISGGPVLVLDGTTPAQEALVLEGGRVLASGSEEDMRALAGGGAERVDLDGATAMPGLIDGHPHFQHFGGWEAPLVSLLDCTNHDEIVERIRERAKTTPAGEWIMTTPVGEPHYFTRRSYRDLDEKRLPDRHVLDRATSEHPVMIQAWGPRTPNVTAFNSMALKLLGIGRITPDQVCDVTIEKDPEDWDRPTGILRGPVGIYYTDDPWWLQVRGRLPGLPDGFWEMGAAAGMQAAAEIGVTSAYEAHAMDLELIQGYQAVRDAGRMTMRVMCALELANWALDPMIDPTPEYIRSQLELASALTQTSDELLRVNGVTCIRGAICWSGHFRHHEPYRDPFGGTTCGRAAYPGWAERMAIDYCCKNDLRLNMGLCSYVDHDEFLANLEPYIEEYDVANRDWVMQHCVYISEAQARRYAKLNFQVTQCSGFLWAFGDVDGERIGEHIWDDLGPTKRLVDLGVNVTASSDWGPTSPFEQMWLAETREFSSGRRHEDRGPAITRDGAGLMQWDDIGSLKTGNHADIAIVDRNPQTCALDDLKETKVLRTVLGGVAVFDDGTLKEPAAVA